MATGAIKKFFRIQYVSDLHLEFYEKAAFPLLVKPAARNLALAGDICQPGHRLFKPFFDYVSSNWDNVFYVTGNHEYYNYHHSKWASHLPETVDERHKQIQAILSNYRNVYYLHKDAPYFYLPKENVAIIGSTLWTHIPEDKAFKCVLGIGDYQYVSNTKGERLRPAEVNQMHFEEKLALQKAIQFWTYQKAQICVITHHMPSYSLISSRYEGMDINCCFASDSEALMNENVKAWIYGHTHAACSGMIRKTFTAVNSRGYPNEAVSGFSSTACFEFSLNPETDEDKPLQEVAAAAAAAEEVEWM